MQGIIIFNDCKDKITVLLLFQINTKLLAKIENKLRYRCYALYVYQNMS